jgi:hypothetical protein
MAHVEDFGATDDYASIRPIGDIWANTEKFGSAKVRSLLDLRSLHVGIFDLRVTLSNAHRTRLEYGKATGILAFVLAAGICHKCGNLCRVALH